AHDLLTGFRSVSALAKDRRQYVVDDLEALASLRRSIGPCRGCFRSSGRHQTVDHVLFGSVHDLTYAALDVRLAQSVANEPITERGSHPLDRVYGVILAEFLPQRAKFCDTSSSAWS